VDSTDWRKKIAKRGEAEKVPNLFFLRKKLDFDFKTFFKVSKYCSYIFLIQNKKRDGGFIIKPYKQNKIEFISNSFVFKKIYAR
jgi:hypothetical protein